MDEFNKQIWNLSDINNFNDHLYSLRNEDKIEWTRNIVNTKHAVLAIYSKTLREISRSIYKGNYESFLDNYDFKYHEGIIIYAYVISKIKDFDKQVKYIELLSKHVDTWSVVDTLKFNIKYDFDKYIKYAYKLSESNKPYKRRIAVRILFAYINYEKYHKDIFDIVNSLYCEEEYYVNMALAWLLCEMFIKQRSAVLEFLENNKLSKFVSLKFVSKCHDSFRISNDDKILLNKYKVKGE